MKKKIKTMLLCMAALLSTAAHAQSAKYYYFYARQNEKVVCEIVSESERTASITSKVVTRYKDDNFLKVQWTVTVQQPVSGDYVLPSEVNLRFFDALYNIDRPVGRYTIVAIGNEGFKGCSKLRSITIPASVRNVSNNVFDGCTMLETINLPSTTENFDISGLANLKSLKAINVESGANGRYSSFSGILCKEKELVFCPVGFQGSVHIPSSVNTIRQDAFRGCDGITDVIVDDGLSSINSSAFLNCSMLKKVVLPNTVTDIGVSAFSSCI